MSPYLANVFDRLFHADTVGDRVWQAVIILGVALLLLFLFDRLVERITPRAEERMAAMTTSDNVMRIRRAETFTGLFITILRLAVIVGALIFIWQLSNPRTGPIALLGIGTVVIVLGSATVGPVLRDMTYGLVMIAERWFNVGDHIVIEPFMASGGIVEKMTLRSTKLRNVNGEAVWIHNQHIMGVKVTSAASHPLIVETFVNDPEKGEKVVRDAIKIVPTGATTLPQPLEITEVKKVDEKIWRITAVCEVTPYREWIVDDFVRDVILKTDGLTGEAPVIVHGPIDYYADTTAEKRFRRSDALRRRVRGRAAGTRP